MSLEVPLSESGSVASASRPACASQSRNRPMTTYQLARREEARAAVVHYDLVDLLNTHTSFNQLLNCQLVCCHRCIGLINTPSALPRYTDFTFRTSTRLKMAAIFSKSCEQSRSYRNAKNVYLLSSLSAAGC